MAAAGDDELVIYRRKDDNSITFSHVRTFLIFLLTDLTIANRYVSRRLIVDCSCGSIVKIESRLLVCDR